MSEKRIEPALTAEEWRVRAVTAPNGAGYVGLSPPLGGRTEIVIQLSGRKGAGVGLVMGSKIHGLAALCLLGEPYGFTWEHVDMVRSRAHDLEAEFDEFNGDRYADSALYERIKAWNEFADLIEALLPPREDSRT